MKLVSNTPMRVGWRAWPFAPGDWRLVVVVKATLELPREGVARLAEEQAFVTGDLHWDDDPDRSLSYDDDLALLKPQGEWWVTGVLRVPEPVSELACLARVGERALRFDVVGERWWRADGGMTPPVPFTEMELSWERAFGGPGYAPNPVGRGLVPDPRDADGRVALPHIERHGRMIRSPYERPEPVCLGPVPRSWSERASLLGTYDDAYRRERWPYFAEDFRWSHFQAARAPQRVEGYWRGDEEIELLHLHPVHPWVLCRLPSIRPRAFVHERARPDALREVGLVLDTIAIDAGEGRAYALWRGSTPCFGESLDELAHLYVTHEPLVGAAGATQTRAEHFGAFVAQLRALWEYENEYEPARVPVAPPPPSAHEPARAMDERPSSPPTLEKMLEGERARARERGWPEAVIEQLFPVSAAPIEDSARRAALASARSAAEQLGLDDVRAVLEQTLAAAPSHVEAPAPNIEPPPGVGSPEALREQVLARIGAGEPLAGLMLIEADLSRLDLSGQDLADALLLRADLRSTRLDGARLDGASLDGAKLDDASFREASARGASFSLVEGSGVDFTGADLSEALVERGVLPAAVFRRVRGESMVLEECLLTGGDFSEAVLRGAELVRNDLDESSFERAVLADARLEGSTLRLACLDQVDASGLRASDGTDLSEARMRWSRLTGASFARSLLLGTKLAESDLTRASFAGAGLAGAELVAVLARGASFDGATLEACSLAGADLLGARFEGASLRLADLRGANLYGAELWRADLTDARLEGAQVEGTKLA